MAEQAKGLQNTSPCLFLPWSGPNAQPEPVPAPKKTALGYRLASAGG